jgi:hypothetical protein
VSALVYFVGYYFVWKKMTSEIGYIINITKPSGYLVINCNILQSFDNINEWYQIYSKISIL